MKKRNVLGVVALSAMLIVPLGSTIASASSARTNTVTLSGATT